MSIKLMVFDLAGTTVYDDNNVAESLQSAMRAYNFSVRIDEINLVMGYPKPEAIRRLLALFPKVSGSDAMVNNIHDLFVRKMTSFYENDAGVREKEGVSETFRVLKENNVLIGIDTGFSRDIAEIIIRRMGWVDNDLIDYSVTSDEVERGRPFPDMIYKIMSEAGITSIEDVAKIGDTVSDLQEGQSAGCKYVIGVTTGAYTKEELVSEYHTHLIADIREVLDIVLPELVHQI